MQVPVFWEHVIVGRERENRLPKVESTRKAVYTE